MPKAKLKVVTNRLVLVDLSDSDEPDKRLTLRMPPDLYQMIADTAEMEGVPVNWWIVKTIGAVFRQRRMPRPRQLG